MRFPHASQSADANTTYGAGATLNRVTSISGLVCRADVDSAYSSEVEGVQWLMGVSSPGTTLVRRRERLDSLNQTAYAWVEPAAK